MRAGFDELFADANGALTFQTTSVIVPLSGDYAITEGEFSVSYTDPTTQQAATTAGHYMTLWKHQSDGSWKILRDISTPGQPEAPVAPASTP